MIKRALLGLLVALWTTTAFAACTSSPCVITSGTTFQVPADFSALVSLEAIGGGGNGSSGNSFNSGGRGGGSAAYALQTTAVLVAGNTYTIQIGIANGTITAGSSSTVGGTGNTGLKDGTGLWVVVANGGSGFSKGVAANSVGTTKFDGASGGSPSTTTGGGGGGGSGKNGSGAVGTDASGGTPGTGGQGDNGTGGTGGTPGNPGSAGTEMNGGVGAGGGGGGGSGGTAGAAGGNYGAGGGGGPIVGAGGAAKPGVLILTYTSINSAKSFIFTPAIIP